MSTGYQIRDQLALHYLNIQVVDWIDVFSSAKLKYLHQNPVRAGLVRKPEDYILASALFLKDFL